MTKKQLQQQIDELKERLQTQTKTDYAVALGTQSQTKTDYAVALGTQWVLGSSTRNFYASHFYDFKDEITDRLNKLEQYLNIEYKVTESKREEGYVKKEDKFNGFGMEDLSKPLDMSKVCGNHNTPSKAGNALKKK